MIISRYYEYVFWAILLLILKVTNGNFFVTEGGRLEAELKYTAKALGEADFSTHQLIIQTAKDPDASLLHAGALLDHLKVFITFNYLKWEPSSQEANILRIWNIFAFCKRTVLTEHLIKDWNMLKI